MSRLLLGVTLSATLSSSVATACEFCLISQGISPLQTLTGGGLRLYQRYSVLDEVYQGSHEAANPGAEERFWTTELSGFYGVNENLLLLATLPVRKTQGDGDVGTDPNGDVDLDTARGGDSGLGDLALLGRYTFLKHHTLTATTLLAVSFGVKLPTGSTAGRDDNGDFLDAHIQLGTGSTDVLLGLSASHAMKRLSVSANMLASITTEGEFGHTDHQFGDSINYDVTTKYRLAPNELGAAPVQWFLSLGVNGEWRGQEREDGLRVADSSGHVVYLTPGIQVIIGAKWILETSFQQAIHHDLGGTQLGEDYKVSGGVTYLF